MMCMFTVEIYKCDEMEDTCGQCLVIESRYHCGWCVDHCSLKNRCPTGWLDQSRICPNPEITVVSMSMGTVSLGEPGIVAYDMIIFVCVCLCVWLRLCVYACVCIYVGVCVLVCVLVCVCACVCVCLCVCVCTSMHVC